MAGSITYVHSCDSDPRTLLGSKLRGEDAQRGVHRLHPTLRETGPRVGRKLQVPVLRRHRRRHRESTGHFFLCLKIIGVLSFQGSSESCNGKGTWDGSKCTCNDPMYTGHYCQYKLECNTDADCNDKGRLLCDLDPREKLSKLACVSRQMYRG